jgi:uncharacterized protein involved in high-affinity Fe2+ transport
MKYQWLNLSMLLFTLWSGGVFGHTHALVLGDKDYAGMHLENGIRSQDNSPQKTIHILWSRLNANAMNPNGFITNDFIPFCVLTYELSKQGSHWHQSLSAPMRLTSTGPEYEIASPLDGPGQYIWHIHYLPPSAGGFYRHTDHATGVDPWWYPFDLNYRFTVNAKGTVQEPKA